VAAIRSQAGEPAGAVMTTTIFVCVSCRRDGEADDDRPGEALVQAIESQLSQASGPHLVVSAVDCLAVCTRPCTVAFCGAGKWTYLIGDIDPGNHAAEIVEAAQSFAISDNGIVPWRERPQSFRKGVIARVPPLSHKEFQ
jgi:predicted metal-binding protein